MDTLKGGSLTPPTFTIDSAEVLTQAAEIFNSFTGIIVLIGGFGLGLTLVSRVISLLR